VSISSFVVKLPGIPGGLGNQYYASRYVDGYGTEEWSSSVPASANEYDNVDDARLAAPAFAEYWNVALDQIQIVPVTRTFDNTLIEGDPI
jgi:hypothetical protein